LISGLLHFVKKLISLVAGQNDLKDKLTGLFDPLHANKKDGSLLMPYHFKKQTDPWVFKPVPKTHLEWISSSRIYTDEEN
jgi:hypothetical protein